MSLRLQALKSAEAELVAKAGGTKDKTTHSRPFNKVGRLDFIIG
jgi:hypothetical protein